MLLESLPKILTGDWCSMCCQFGTANHQDEIGVPAEVKTQKGKQGKKKNKRENKDK